MVIPVFSPVVTSAERCECRAEIRPRHDLFALCTLEFTAQDEHLMNGRAGEATKKNGQSKVIQKKSQNFRQ